MPKRFLLLLNYDTLQSSKRHHQAGAYIICEKRGKNQLFLVFFFTSENVSTHIERRGTTLAKPHTTTVLVPGGQSRTPLKPIETSRHYGTEGFNRDPQLISLTAEGGYFSTFFIKKKKFPSLNLGHIVQRPVEAPPPVHVLAVFPLDRHVHCPHVVAVNLLACKN